MMKHEFEERVGGEISDQNYEIIETVYTWHPAINEVGGKDQIAALYETGGMPLIKSMLEAANIMMDLDKERRQAMRRMEEIRRRIETVASGDLDKETSQCMNPVRYVLGMEDAIRRDDLVVMRRCQDPEYYVKYLRESRKKLDKILGSPILEPKLREGQLTIWDFIGGQ